MLERLMNSVTDQAGLWPKPCIRRLDIFFFLPRVQSNEKFVSKAGWMLRGSTAAASAAAAAARLKAERVKKSQELNWKPSDQCGVKTDR